MNVRAVAVALLAIVAGLVAGAVAAAILMLMGAAAFWLFIFGDDPWPATAETVLIAVAYAMGAVAAVVVAINVWRTARAGA